MPRETQPSQSERPLRAYYVVRRSRTETTYIIHATTATEARDAARRGEGEPIDSVTTGGVYGQARRATAEDRR